MRFFISIPDQKARAAIIAANRRKIAELNEDIAYLESLSQTHIQTYSGSTPVADVLAALRAEIEVLEGEIASL